MGNHSYDCEYCGNDLRPLGSTHTKECPSNQISFLTRELIFNQALSDWDKAKVRQEISRLKREE